MFNIGGGEMVLLAVIALVVFGPESLPGLIKTVTRTVRALRTAAGDFQLEVKNALEEENVRQDLAKRQRSNHSNGAAAKVVSPTATLPVSTSSDMDTEATTEAQVDPVPTLESDSDVAKSGTDIAKSDTDQEPNLASSESKPDLREAAPPENPTGPEPEEFDDDDDGPGLPMPPRQVGETA